MDISPVSFDRATAAVQPLQQSHQFQQETREVARAVQKLNEVEFAGVSRELTIIVDPKTRRATVRIVDKETGEIVQQIPPEYVLRMAQEAKVLQRGE
jgi:uncharacterized FlaG/YvyC family protein